MYICIYIFYTYIFIIYPKPARFGATLGSLPRAAHGGPRLYPPFYNRFVLESSIICTRKAVYNRCIDYRIAHVALFGTLLLLL